MTSGSPAASLHLTTSDVGAAEDVLRQIGAPARISLAAGVADEGFRFDVAGQGDEEVTFASFGVEGRWSVKTELDVYVLAICLDGALGWCSGAQSGALAGEAVLLPAGFSELEVDGSARVFEVQFTAAALLRFARQFYDVEYMHLRIEAGVARSHAHRAMTAAALQYALAFTNSGAIGDPQLLASLKANLAATLLSGFRVTGPRREWRLSDRAERKAFQRAAELIETNAHRPISVLDVAGHAALPLDLLDASFRRQTGYSVASYLEMARTIGAHGDLVRSERDVGTVAVIARRWGFTSRIHLLREHAKLYPHSELRSDLRI